MQLNAFSIFIIKYFEKYTIPNFKESNKSKNCSLKVTYWKKYQLSFYSFYEMLLHVLYYFSFVLQDVTPLTVVPSNTALRLKALRDFEDGQVKRIAGDEWLFEGPGN